MTRKENDVVVGNAPCSVCANVAQFIYGWLG